MASKKDGGKLDIQKLITGEDFENVMELSQSRLVLVDIHQDWCGVCDALHPTLQRVLQDYDMCQERMTICSASIAALGEQLQKALPSDAAVVLDKNGCLPLFALFRFKTCVAAISGVDAPSLLSAIAINMPDKPAPVAVAVSE